ncbi:hypothetical protein MTO96_009394 [Rhipicephalus appendiculatus]
MGAIYMAWKVAQLIARELRTEVLLLGALSRSFHKERGGALLNSSLSARTRRGQARPGNLDGRAAAIDASRSMGESPARTLARPGGLLARGAGKKEEEKKARSRGSSRVPSSPHLRRTSAASETRAATHPRDGGRTSPIN